VSPINPFKYGRVVSGRDFFGREDLIAQLAEHMESSQNVVLHGDRRVGKTSLIHEMVRRKKLTLLYVDFMSVRSEDDMCRRILREVIALENASGFLKKIMATLAHLRPVLSVDPITMAPEIKLDASLRLGSSSISETIALIASLHGEKPKLAVAFDEFQDIGRLPAASEIYALMRSKIQFHEMIPYIFAGSNQHKLDMVFTSPDSPFFKSAIPLSVGPFPREEFMSFIIKKFKLGQRVINKASLTAIFDTCRDVPGDVQQFCEAVWSVSAGKGIISEKTIAEALNLIFTRERGTYEYITANLTDVQARCLFALARIGGSSVFSQAFSKESGNLIATNQRAVEMLLKKGIIYENRGAYEFISPFFKHWIKIN